MFKKLFLVFFASLFFVSFVEGKLKKVTKEKEAVTQASPVQKDISGPRVTKEGVEFIYVNPSAKSVFVAGSFNNWDASKNAMIKDKNGVWRLLLALKAGVHQYKFIVDGKWMEDPLNANTTDDGYGGKNSVIEVKFAPEPAAVTGKGPQVTKDGVKFIYKNPTARTVNVAGEFNNWNINADPMVKQKDGTWVLLKPLPRGRYQYKFVVDGNWLKDPDNPNVADDGFGGENSVVVVADASAGTQKVSTTGPRQTKGGVEFSLVKPDARSVVIAGSFNNWSQSSHPLTKDKNGVWKIVIPLSRGVYYYKFVVDGKWMEDPANPKFTDDGYGGKNSVVTVEGR